MLEKICKSTFQVKISLQILIYSDGCWSKQMIYGRFVWSAKISNAYFSVAIIRYLKATLTLALHMLTLVC